MCVYSNYEFLPLSPRIPPSTPAPFNVTQALPPPQSRVPAQQSSLPDLARHHRSQKEGIIVPLSWENDEEIHDCWFISHFFDATPCYKSLLFFAVYCMFKRTSAMRKTHVDKKKCACLWEKLLNGESCNSSGKMMITTFFCHSES